MIHSFQTIALNQTKQYKQRFVSHIQDMPELDGEFLALVGNQDNTVSAVQPRKVVKGQVIHKTKSHITVDVNAKNECVIPISEFQLDKNKPVPEVGELIDVYVETLQDKSGKTVLSRERAIREEAWVPLEKAFKNNELVKGVIFGQIKGGLTVDLSGIVAFLPGSQIDTKPVQDVSSLMDIVQNFQIIKMDKELDNIIVSRRKVIELAKAGERTELYKKLAIGTKLRGTVKNITDYGAFIDLLSTDGLVHITDISWKRINHPSEVLTIGQEVEVVVIDLEDLGEGNKKISLGIKQLDDTAWQNIKAGFHVGKVFTSKITNVTDYGVFASLQDGIDGLIHSSQLKWTKVFAKDIKNLYQIGDSIKCTVTNIDDVKYRVSLSAKQCIEKPWIQFIKQHPVGSTIDASIKSITSFGIFVGLLDDLTGLIRESDIHAKDKSIVKNYQVGQSVKCKVTSIDEVKGRIGLALDL